MSRKNKKKHAGGAADAHERRLAQLEERRKERAAREAALARKEKRERFVRFAVLGFVLAGLIWFVFLRHHAPTEINGHKIEALSRGGVGDHPADPSAIVYPTKPPVSGPHDPTPATCGVHDQQIPDPMQVHSLEHGAVGIQYLPTLDPAKIKSIEDLVSGYDQNVFSAPYEGLDTPIAVSAWGYLMPLSDFDATTIQGFIEAFAGKGPEPGTSCPNASDQPFQPGASPSPSATSSPTPGSSPSPKPSADPSPGK
jgi:hypothetical protein